MAIHPLCGHGMARTLNAHHREMGRVAFERQTEEATIHTLTMKVTYKFPADFSHSLHNSFVHTLLANSHRLTDAIMHRCEAITRQANAKAKTRWEARYGDKHPYRFEPCSTHLLQAIREGSQPKPSIAD
jgi:hypothetical protein